MSIARAPPCAGCGELDDEAGCPVVQDVGADGRFSFRACAQAANLLWYLMALGSWLVPRYQPDVYVRTLRLALPPPVPPAHRAPGTAPEQSAHRRPVFLERRPRPLQGLSALVTGGATAIGAEIGRALAAAGATVAVDHLGQDSDAHALGGPEMRENFSTRVLVRYTLDAWKMLVPEVHPAPKPTRHPGRVQGLAPGAWRAPPETGARSHS
ncbi:hypothetical protein ABTX77_39020 [Streptomyces sp. NPDC097704]|uniref:hypothetical protein n=1 Tax=Streptomyces sp. NPDC097704 TaxID=3157101 RepID=UPI00332C66CC